jgi:transposase
MFFAFESYRYYLRPGPTDMRRQGEALARTVQSQMRLDPFSKSMFLFCSGRRTLLKVLVWDGSGFWLMSKRLYGGTFRWPSDEREALRASLGDVRRLLGGQDVFRRVPVQGGARVF